MELVKIQNDGTVEVDLEKNPPVASELLEFQSVDGASVDRSYSSFCDVHKTIPRLKIAILVVGTRGDVQPFVAIAKRLQACFMWFTNGFSLRFHSILVLSSCKCC